MSLSVFFLHHVLDHVTCTTSIYGHVIRNMARSYHSDRLYMIFLCLAFLHSVLCKLLNSKLYLKIKGVLLQQQHLQHNFIYKAIHKPNSLVF